MWNRADLKSRAWELLRTTYWKCFLATIITGIIIGVASQVMETVNQFFSIGTAVVTSAFQSFLQAFEPFNFFFFFRTNWGAMSLLTSIIFIFVGIAGILLAVFLEAPLKNGLKAYFMRNRNGTAKLETLFFAFQNNYWNIVKTNFLVSLYEFLWSLLFIIPGIIKHYEYYMVPYILTENPGMDQKRAFEISRLMTDGEKMNIFIMELSFIGWYLLGIVACAIGIIFVPPYVDASMAELYAAMRDKAFYFNFASPEELPGYSAI